MHQEILFELFLSNISLCHFIDFFCPYSNDLLCIVGELSGGGSVAVAVGVSDR